MILYSYCTDNQPWSRGFSSSRTLCPCLTRFCWSLLVTGSFTLALCIRCCCSVSYWTLHPFLSLHFGRWSPYSSAVCPIFAACLPCCLCGTRLGAAVLKSRQGAEFSSSLLSSATNLSVHFRSKVSSWSGIWLADLHSPCYHGIWLRSWFLEIG